MIDFLIGFYRFLKSPWKDMEFDKNPDENPDENPFFEPGDLICGIATIVFFFFLFLLIILAAFI